MNDLSPGSPSTRARVAARVLVVGPDRAVLLFRGSDPARPAAGTWWFTPGGGVDSGETIDEGERYHQHEHFFAVRVDRFEPDVRGWTEIEQRSMSEHRWWTSAEIAASDETFYPEDLVARLAAITE